MSFAIFNALIQILIFTFNLVHSKLSHHPLEYIKTLVYTDLKKCDRIDQTF